MPVEKLVIDNFVGGMVDETVVSKASNFEGSHFIDCNNVHLWPRGAVSVRPGFRITTGTTSLSAASIDHIAQYTKPDTSTELPMIFSTKRLIAGTTVYTSAGVWYVTGTSISMSAHALSAETDGLYDIGSPATAWKPTPATPPVTCPFSGMLVMTYDDIPEMLMIRVSGGEAEPYTFQTLKKDGATLYPKGCCALTTWQSYLFVGGIANDGLDSDLERYSRVRWCLDTNANWNEDYYIDLDPEDPDKILCMINVGDLILVFKRRKTFVIRYVGGQNLFEYTRISAGIGCLGPHAACEFEGKVYFVGEDGFYVTDGTQITEISSKIKGHIRNINKTATGGGIMRVSVYKPLKQIWFGVGYGKDEFINREYIYDIELGSWTKFDIKVGTFGNIITQTQPLRIIDLGPIFPGVVTQAGERGYSQGGYYNYYKDITLENTGVQDPIFMLTTFPSSIRLYGGRLIGRGLTKMGLAQLASYGAVNFDYFGSVDALTPEAAIDAYFTSTWQTLGDPMRNKRIYRLVIYNEPNTTSYSQYIELYKDWSETTSYYSGYEYMSQGYPAQLQEKRYDISKVQCRTLSIKVGSKKMSPLDTYLPRAWTVYRMILDYRQVGRTLVGYLDTAQSDSD